MEEVAKAPIEAVEQDLFAELQQEDASLISLIRILLSPRTFPHLVLIFVFAIALNFMANAGSQVASAVGFLSLSGGYLLTGLLSGNERIRAWTQLPERDEAESSPRWKRLLFSFRICLLPLLFAAICMVALNAAGDGKDALPVVLSSCFVVWAIVQGRSFGRFLSSLSAKKLPEPAQRTSGRTATSGIFSCVLIIALAGILVVLFEFLATSKGWMDALLDNLIFFGIAVGLFLLTWRRTRHLRQQASLKKDLHSFTVRWLFLSQLLITWHLLTVWRHWAISPGGPMLFIEELVLMVFTVLMAIWGLTSRSFRSPLKLVSLDNALPIGLAFGYAYAGSVAMLTVVLDDVKNVMMAGHIVVLLTFMWMQSTVLKGVFRSKQQESNIKHIVENIVPAPVEEHEEGKSSTSEPMDTPEVEDTSPPVETAIGSDVEWREPKVLANEDVDWDDEIEVLD
jgi:hypothetical protein